MKMTDAEKIALIRQFALDNYEKDGWDTVVECYDDAEILAVVKTARSHGGCIHMMKKEITPGHRYAQEIRSTAW